MGLFDFFKRRKNGSAKPTVQYDDMSRIEYLLYIHHESMEEPKEAYGNIDFVELVERQLSESKNDLAFNNLGSHVREYFNLACLYWGQGDVETAASYLDKAIERQVKMHALSVEHNFKKWPHRCSQYAKAAACLLNNHDVPFQTQDNDMGYQPWFIETLLSYCLGDNDFDEATWQEAEDKWIKNRFPKYRLEEFNVYIKALTGQFNTSEDMLAAHEAMFKGRGKRNNADSDLLDGYNDNDIIIDYIFASILKRIGWEGRYRHSWPNTDLYDSTPETYCEAHSYLKIIAAPKPQIDPDTGIISDLQMARRFIDNNLSNQRFEGDELYSAERSAKTRGKVSGALRDLGWVKDRPTLDLMQTYRMDNILNETTHIFLCDPVKSDVSIKDWTESLSSEFDLHLDFIAIAGSEEKSDYMDPQGSWYVYWKKDKRIYAVERDDWNNPAKATKNARMGLTLWPSYTSFVAWWISEHLQSELR